MSDDNELSTRGLDEYANRFLRSNDSETPEDIKVTKGREANEEMMTAYVKQQKADFIRRTGRFTDDLVGFIVEQKSMRSLDDKDIIFGLALANINLRYSHCRPQNEEEEKTFTAERGRELNKEWESLCWAAQCYFDENV